MKEYLIKIKEVSQNLPFKKLILFCNLNCEKMFPGYEIFTRIEKSGDADFILSVISHTYENLLMADNADYYNKTISKLETIFPDLDNFTSSSASYAFDFCVALHEMISYILTNDNTHVTQNAGACFNTVDMFVQQKENVGMTDFKSLPALEKLIDGHEFMLKEIERQNILLKNIQELSNVDTNSIQALRTLNNSFGDQIEYELLFSE